MAKEEDIEYDGFDESRGMYGNGDDSYFEELDITSLDQTTTGFTDVYGDQYSENLNTNEVGDPFVYYSEGGTKANILGLPLNFCKTADPNGRVYKDTIMTNIPYVFIIPGKGVLNHGLVDDNGKRVKKGDLLDQLESLEDNIAYGVKGVRNGADLRFLSFKANYDEYYKYVQVIANTLHATMGLSGVYHFSENYKNKSSKFGLCFYANNSTRISEDVSNDYSQSSIVQKANDLSAQSREYKTLLGIDTTGNSLLSKGLGFISDAFSKVSEITDSSGVLARTGQVFGRVVNGAQLLYPEIWSDSSFSRSYSINFKFYSPYGDKESIFNYVYVPFAAIMAFSFPVQDSVMGYGQPFCIRLCQPGWFESSMAVVTSVSFVKGGDDNLWTIDGLPQEITVSLSIKDLYPTVPITKKYSMLVYNLGLASFLDNLSGIRADQLNLVLRTKTFVKTRMSVPSSFIKNGIKNKISDYGYELQQKLSFVR